MLQGNRLVAAKGKRTDAVYQCKDFSANLQAAFCITANADLLTNWATIKTAAFDVSVISLLKLA